MFHLFRFCILQTKIRKTLKSGTKSYPHRVNKLPKSLIISVN